MPPFLRFLLYRLISVPVTILIITAVLYAGVMVTPAETRATLYLPKRLPSRMTEAQYQSLIDSIIKRHHLDAPYPVQYVSWLGNLVKGVWGYSPVLQQDVLEALLARTPATAELTLYSLLLFIPTGLLAGVISGWKLQKKPDYIFRMFAFLATSVPSFILALLFLAIFYVMLRWFPPERLSLFVSLSIDETSFSTYTGLLTLDGILNGRFDVTLDALRHLVLPVITLSMFHWASLGRVTRATLLDELSKEYVLAAKARGISRKRVIWKHAMRNALAPALTSTFLSAATLVTGVYIVEIIYNFHGISALIVRGTIGVPDAPAALGFAVYSTVIVILLMLFLDVLQAMIDPRVREGVLTG